MSARVDINTVKPGDEYLLHDLATGKLTKVKVMTLQVKDIRCHCMNGQPLESMVLRSDYRTGNDWTTRLHVLPWFFYGKTWELL